MRKFKKKLVLLVATSMSFGALVCLSNQKILDTVHAATTETDPSTSVPETQIQEKAVTFNFKDFPGFSEWKNSYSKKTTTLNGFSTGDITLTLGGASKQGFTITDIPVSKKSTNTIKLTNGYFKSIKYTFRQWKSNAPELKFTDGTKGGLTIKKPKVAKPDPSDTSGNTYFEPIEITFPTDSQLNEINFDVVKNDQIGFESISFVIATEATVGHAVSFMNNDKLLKTVNVDNNTCVEEPTDLTPLGYKFEGWFKDAAFTIPFDFTSPITDATTVYGKFTPDYSLNFPFVDGQKYEIKGEVVGRIKSDKVMIQDDKGAILVNDPKVSELTIGQEISFKGKYSEPNNDIPNFNGLTELNVLTTDEFTITPITDLTQVTKDNVSKYVELKDLEVESIDINSNAYKKIKLVNQDFMITLHESNYANITGFTSFADIKAGTMISVKGAINVHDKDLQIFPNELSYEVKYTVSFNTNGGTEVPTQELGRDSKVTLPTTNPTKEGYEFIGWFTDEACTEAFDAETIITADTTLYAGWKDIRPSLTLGDVPAIMKVGEEISLAATVANVLNPKVTWTVTEGDDLITLHDSKMDGNISTQKITALKEGIVKLTAKVEREQNETPVEPVEVTFEIKHEIRDVEINPMVNLGLSFIRNGEDGIIASSMSVATVNKTFNWTDSEGVKFLDHVTANNGVVDLNEQFLLEEQRNRLSVEYKQNTAEHAYLTSKEIRLYKGKDGKGGTLTFNGLKGLTISEINITYGKNTGNINVTVGETTQTITKSNTSIKFNEGVSGFELSCVDTASIANIEITYEKPGKVNKYTDVRLGYQFSLPTTFTDEYTVTKAGVKVMNGETLVKDIEAKVEANTYTATLTKITDENLTTKFKAIPYVVIDDVTYELESINYSVEEMVDAYLAMGEDLDGTLNPIVKDLKNHINQLGK